MGCGSGSLATEELVQLKQQLMNAREPAFSAADDRQALSVEVDQLRTHVKDLVSENETIKQKVDRVMANRNPEIFENTQEVNDMIANWMEMDMRDGDELLVALGRVHPPSSDEVNSMLAMSAALKQRESSLEEYYRYFEKRFKVFQTIWARIVGIHSHMDEAFKRFKDSMATNLVTVESILGKKSPAMDELRVEVRDLMKLQYDKFMDQQWRLQNKIIQIKIDHCARRIEEKEQEKQRFFAKCEADNKVLKAKHQQELENKEEEIKAILEAKRVQQERAEQAQAYMMNTHSGRTVMLKQLMKKRLEELEMWAKSALQGFADYQAEAQQQIKAHCEQHEREVLALKAKHKQEKALMRSLMTTANTAFRGEYVQLASNFSTFQQKIQEEIAEFCDKYREEKLERYRQYDSRIELLLEDARCEAKRRDEKAAREKQGVLRLISSFRREFSNQSSDFVGYMGKMREWVYACMREAHDEYAYALRQEGLARSQMLVEEHIQEVIKRDKGKAALINQHENALNELYQQFRTAETVLKEDALHWVFRHEENADKQDRKRAQALEECLTSHLAALEGNYCSHIQASDSTLVSLQPYGLAIPEAILPESALAEPGLCPAQLTGAVLYVQAVSTLHTSLQKSQRTLEKFLQDKVMRESWLVKEWLLLENRRNTLQNQLNLTISDYERQVTELRKGLQDSGENHDAEFKSLSQKIASLEDIIKENETDLQARQDTIATLSTQLATSEQQCSANSVSIQDLQTVLREKSEELSVCQGKIAELEQMAATHVEGAQQIITQLQEEISQNERKYELNKRGKAYRHMITDFRHRTKGIKRSYLLRWKLRISGHVPVQEEPSPAIFDDEDSEADDNAEMDLVEEFIQEEYRFALENNVMVKTFNSAGGNPERPLTIPQALKFFEDMMDKKYEADLGDIKNGRPLQPLPDFFLEFMNRTFGLKKLAIKMLCQIIPTLELMNNDGSPYCQLFCRLVQINHPSPVSFQLSVFLTRVRMEFNTFAEKYQRDKDARDSKKGIKVGKGKGKEVSSTGGEAYLLDIMAYLSGIFESDRRSSEQMLKLLQPASVDTVDYVIFRICHKVSKLGIPLESVFALLDKDGSGSLNEMEFVKVSRRALDLWMPMEDLSLCFRAITNGAKEMTKEMFLERINYKSYLKNCKSDLYIVSRVTFLLSFIEVNHSRQKHDGARIKGLIGAQGAVPQDAFEALIRRMENNIDQAKIAALYNESLKLTPDASNGAAVSAVIKVLLRHPVGILKKSPFCKD